MIIDESETIFRIIELEIQITNFGNKIANNSYCEPHLLKLAISLIYCCISVNTHNNQLEARRSELEIIIRSCIFFKVCSWVKKFITTFFSFKDNEIRKQSRKYQR